MSLCADDDLYSPAAICQEGMSNGNGSRNEATSLALDLGVGKCVISSDCLEVIMNIQKQNLCVYAAILNEIKARTTLFQKVVFKHEGRNSNNKPHVLAKSVCKLAPGRYVWLLGCPEILHVPQNIVNN